MVTKKQLAEAISKLNAGQLDLLFEMASCMGKAIEEVVSKDSDILTEEFRANFSNRLLVHHATHEEKFKKKSFEYAFCAASRSAARQARIVSDPTNPGADVIVDGRSFSLKTEAAASISENNITISKLMEARWIRDCKSKRDFAQHTLDRVVGHLEKYDRILTLRAFGVEETHVRYDLVEIPKELLLAISQLKAKDFSKRTAAGGSGATVSFDGSDAFKLRLDGSVEKVTISGLKVSLCVSHGSWEIPTLAGRES